MIENSVILSLFGFNSNKRYLLATECEYMHIYIQKIVLVICLVFGRGTTLWTQTVFQSSTDLSSLNLSLFDAKLISVSDGRVLIGDTEGKDSTNYDVTLIKFDEHLNILWHTTFGRKKTELSRSMIEIKKGEIIASSAIGPETFFLQKINSNGKKRNSALLSGFRILDMISLDEKFSVLASKEIPHSWIPGVSIYSYWLLTFNAKLKQIHTVELRGYYSRSSSGMLFHIGYDQLGISISSFSQSFLEKKYDLPHEEDHVFVMNNQYEIIWDYIFKNNGSDYILDVKNIKTDSLGIHIITQKGVRKIIQSPRLRQLAEYLDAKPTIPGDTVIAQVYFDEGDFIHTIISFDGKIVNEPEILFKREDYGLIKSVIYPNDSTIIILSRQNDYLHLHKFDDGKKIWTKSWDKTSGFSYYYLVQTKPEEFLFLNYDLNKKVIRYSNFNLDGNFVP